VYPERLDYVLEERSESSSSTAAATANQSGMHFLTMPSLCTSNGNPLVPDSFSENTNYDLQHDAETLAQKIEDHRRAKGNHGSRSSKRRTPKTKRQSQHRQPLVTSTASKRDAPPSPNDVITATLMSASFDSFFHGPSDCNDLGMIDGVSVLNRREQEPMTDSTCNNGSSILIELLKDEKEKYGSRKALSSSSKHRTSTTKECRNDDSGNTHSTPHHYRSGGSRQHRNHNRQSHDESNNKNKTTKSRKSSTRIKKVVRFVDPLVTSCQYRPKFTEDEKRELFFDPDELYQLEMDRQETQCEYDEVEMVASFIPNHGTTTITSTETSTSRVNKKKDRNNHKTYQPPTQDHQEEHREHVAQVLLSGISTYSRRPRHYADLDRHRKANSILDGKGSFDESGATAFSDDSASMMSI